MSPATITHPPSPGPSSSSLAGVLLFAAARRRDTDEVAGVMSSETARRDRGPVALSEQGEAAPAHRARGRAGRRGRPPRGRQPVKVSRAPVAWVPPDEETIGVTRRQFFNRSIVATFAFGLSGFGAAVLAFLWPSNTGGFGSKINVGKIDDIRAKIEEGEGFAYYPEGRMWVTEYPEEALGKAEAMYSPPELAGMEAGLIALWQKCPHLGCRVPSCVSSQWFECGCHGSQYNQVGEKKGGPAPAAWTGSPWRSTATSSSWTPARSSTARPSAPTPPARRPRAPTASRAAATGALPVRAYDRAGRQHGHHGRRRHRGAAGGRLRRLRHRQHLLRPARGRLEIELAPNRKPYLSDEELETTKLNRTLRWALVLLVIVAVGLPLYWLNEPGRMDGAEATFQDAFVSRGRGAVRRGLAVPELPRPRGHRRPGAVHDPRPRREVRGHGQLAGAGARHRAAALHPRRGRVHHQLGPAVLADARLGRRRQQGPAQRAADPEPHRLPRVDPAHPEEAQRQAQVALAEDLGLVEEGRATRTSSGRSRTSTTTTRRSARRCSTRTPPAAPSAAPAATPGAGRSSPRATTPSTRRTPTCRATPGSPTAAGPSAPT